MMIDARLLFGTSLLALAVPAAAETLPINAADPAAADVIDLIRISVERFEGEDGAAFAQALEAELADANFRGGPFYHVVAPESGAPTDALVTGTIRSSVEDVPVIEKRQRCTEYDPADKKKCLQEIDVDIRCRRRTATVATTVRLVVINDGSIRYTRPLNARDQVTYCPDRSAPQSVEDYFTATFRNQVRAIRSDLAPRDYTLDVRVDESTKGLTKPVQAAFKAAVRQTKTDPFGACSAWNLMSRDTEPTPALAFNMGLCAEMEGELDAAVAWYANAQRQGSRSGAIPQALARIDRHRRALGAWVARKVSLGRE
ncbi:hypothetical protein [Sphingopyxis sp.]|uniref:hypothetical protein n=1 Tax=Sphingopyxis sp. TaxID=1908224 RepID=UPI001DD5379E|nr:hypothetical protein [Sphingopyxis sp.]MBW8297878.1 hypothetical protein [Sphingopyxis sp.]